MQTWPLAEEAHSLRRQAQEGSRTPHTAGAVVKSQTQAGEEPVGHPSCRCPQERLRRVLGWMRGSKRPACPPRKGSRSRAGAGLEAACRRTMRMETALQSTETRGEGVQHEGRGSMPNPAQTNKRTWHGIYLHFLHLSCLSCKMLIGTPRLFC